MVSSSTSAIFDGTMVNVNNNTINKKISKGRQKIEIKKIEAKESRQVTFSKRRTGLFKKAVELCVMTEAKVAILVKSPGGKVFVLGEDLIDWYINNVVETAQLGFPRNDECDDDEVGNNEEEPVVETGEVGIIPYNTSNSDNKSVDEMDIEHAQLEEYAMKKDADMKVDELEMNNNIPAMLGSEERKKNEVVEANDSEVINNSDLNPAVLDSDLLDMSWLDLDPYDMSWIDSCDHGDLNTNDTYNLNFQHGVEV